MPLPALLLSPLPADSQGGGGGFGRHRGIDPVLPYVDPEQLAQIAAFYGLAPDCPVPQALVRLPACHSRLVQPASDQPCSSCRACRLPADRPRLSCSDSSPLQIARSTEPRPKKLNYVSPAVRDLLRLDVGERLKVRPRALLPPPILAAC